MPDNSWDNTNAAPRLQKGMPVWGKVALGCGITLVLLLGSCVGLLTFGYHKATGAMDEAWAQLRSEVQALETEPGARELYRKNPGLMERYPTEAEFLQAAQHWQKKLKGFPEQRPELLQMIKHKQGFSLHTQMENGRKIQRLRMKLDNGTTLRVEMENDRLTDLVVD